jgi:hypothetical protein
MTAPKMGAIRSLPLIAGVAARSVPAEGRWTLQSGLLFSSGFALLVIGVVGFFFSYRSYLVPYREVIAVSEHLPDGKLPDYSDLAAFEARAATLSVEQLWSEWREGLRENLDEWRPFKIRVLLDQMDEIYQYLMAFAVTAGLGLLMSLASFFFIRKSPVQAR